MQPFISLFFFALLVNLADLRKSVAPATQIYSLRLAHRPAICANHPPMISPSLSTARPYDFYCFLCKRGALRFRGRPTGLGRARIPYFVHVLRSVSIAMPEHRCGYS